MRKFLLSAVALAFAFGATAQANELDNESVVTNEQAQLAQELPATLVVRVKDNSNQVEVLHSNEELSTDAATREAITKAQFSPMNVDDQMVGELDRDSSSSSWYFHFPRHNYHYPSYYYYGYHYSYASYYSYRWGSYYYYYYSWQYGRRW